MSAESQRSDGRPESELAQPFAFSAEGGFNLAQMTAQDRIAWAINRYGDKLMMSTSMGAQAAVLLHMVTVEERRAGIVVPKIFIDTQHLWPETYDYAHTLGKRIGLQGLITVRAAESREEQERKYGRRWEQGAEAMDAYRVQNKVEPMNRAVSEGGYMAWISGLRRGQNPRRQTLPFVEQQARTDKVYPLLDWTSKQVFEYMRAHDLPQHPLFEQHGYTNIGDFFEDPWSKPECGLHEQQNKRPTTGANGQVIDWNI